MPQTQQSQTTLFIGVMSGTSLDGVDVVLVEFSDTQINIIANHSHVFPKSLREKLIEITNPKWQGSLADIGLLNRELGLLFANSTNALLDKTNFDKSKITAIGNHGQTVWHQPLGKHPFSMQLGDASLMAETTGITTIADFRSRDIAADGQGAPLVPAFHQEFFAHPKKDRVILNLGGIANITNLPSAVHEAETSGYDTGPGNGLLDAWIFENKQQHFDKNGDWARSGKILPDILQKLLSYEFFSEPPPKSTGKEAFNLAWLNTLLGDRLTSEKPEDIQATLVELTAKSVADNIEYCDELFICGGGIHNHFLVERLQHHLPESLIASTEKVGIDPDWVEAIAFAWLAKQTIEGKTANLPAVTGAKGKRILGVIYPA